ncbi:MAG: DUF6541 family protein, partial [Anaerolineales bacterium]
YPILFLWTDLIGLHLGPLYAWLPSIGGLTFMVWRMSKAVVTRRRKVRLWPGLRITFQSWLRSQNFWPDLALLIVTGLTFATRFWAIRSLDVPLWGDSYHHTLIAQLLVDHGGLFDSWQPYAELQTFTYHFGFHALAAVLHWITQWALPSATLWAGQILNGLAALALYPLAFRLSGNRWGGVGAVLVAGLLAPMPMAYINWGRYTQLAGQAILPAAMWLTWVAVESGRRPRRNWGLIALVWLASAGVALSHYRVLIFYLGFVLVLTAGLIVQTRDWRRVIARVMAVGGGATILFLPWFVHVFAGQIFLILGAQLAAPPGEASAWTAQNGVGSLDFYLSPWLWLLLLLGLAWGLWRRQMDVALIGLWWLLVLLAANPGRLGLPGAGAVNNFAVLIAAYIPAGILAGAALGWLMNAHGCRRGVALAVSLLLVGLGAWGAQQRLGDVGVSESALVTIPDQRAAEWIRANTPPDARFLTNAFFAYSGTLVVGSDAGWWLPLLAGRSTALPPINYGTEQGPRPDYREWVNRLSARVFEKGLDDSETLALLREQGIAYIYVG